MWFWLDLGTYSEPRGAIAARDLKPNDFYAGCDSLCISFVKVLLREIAARIAMGKKSGLFPVISNLGLILSATQQRHPFIWRVCNL